jgi:hypothetical protein
MEVVVRAGRLAARSRFVDAMRDLGFERQFAYLVEKHRPAMGWFKAPLSDRKR